jgi:plastocyanin
VTLAPGATWHTCLDVYLTLDGIRSRPKCRCDAFGTLADPLAERASAWHERLPRLRSAWDGLDHLYGRSIDDLAALLMEDPDGAGDLVVAAGLPWFMALFGRDAILTALMALPFDRELAAGVLRTLARHQGEREDEASEEQPGWILHEMRFGMAVPSQAPEESISGQVPDLDSYPARAVDDPWASGTGPTRSFTLSLGETTSMPSSHDGVPGMPGMAGMNTRYTINGAAFPQTGVLTVRQGDRVQITFVNRGQMEHPMHLHGQSFRLLARDGQPLPGALVMDTILTEPGSSFTVGFVAGNPGWWAIHCHELHHAAGGMMALLRCDGSPRLAQLGGSAGNDAG